MGTLTIRNLPDAVHERLRLRAAKAGTSLEAEVRCILERAAFEEPTTLSAPALQAFVDSLYGAGKPSGVVDDLLQQRRRDAAGEGQR